MNWKVKKLMAGETVISKEGGNSMMPIIKSKQPVKLEPITWDKCEADDIVFCRVHGNYYTHFIKAVNPNKGCLIGNNKGGINGWTKQVYGKVIEIL